MGRGEELSDFQRGTVVGCHLSKKSTREISALLALPQSTVSSVIVKWKRERRTTTLPRCGRPQKLREEDRKILERVAREKCFTSIEALTAEFQSASGSVVSSNTIRRELHEMGFRGRVSSYSKAKGKERVAKKQAAPCQEDGGADVSGLDLRVGRIITAVQLPDTDSLYMEQVDVGEASPRMVVSKLSKHVSVDQVQNRMVVLLCNLKPAMTKGFVSQAVLLCARSSDKVEILDPPSGAVPGDRVTSQQFSGEPDKGSTLEKMAWEHIQPDLCTDAQCVATYKGDALEVKGKGVCTVQTMKNSQIE
ncbi:aminoacyl tRNA synthase complex-interacting multifunctional protein 1-like [Salarias fasciatus]|uniref:aminoacyl tRNA synthase complex-interacting multifunctional protein 1-like n=1 Tax=Salarias fasciatus TaxID=181472 RepID=UPI0011769054|nr:aminoacyl tRNA synthase complex-interacting multifunctional protein 1-like [Salarias fasciatus]